MKLLNNSGPAIFMYSVIAICLIVSSICFGFFYTGTTDSIIVFWIGMVTFTIMYHFWVRIIMGNVLKLFKKHITYKQYFFKEKKFEKKFYDLIKVKLWKDKVLTYAPQEFDLKENSLETVANNMAKAELDHWINSLISISTIFFGFISNVFWPFVVSAIFAMAFETQFIVLQRYNRPRVVKIIEREERKEKNQNREKNKENNSEENKEEIKETSVVN